MFDENKEAKSCIVVTFQAITILGASAVCVANMIKHASSFKFTMTTSNCFLGISAGACLVSHALDAARQNAKCTILVTASLIWITAQTLLLFNRRVWVRQGKHPVCMYVCVCVCIASK